jgi:hypothetical protein
MSSYVIGIGGSGARCLEALLYLCAAGLGPQDLTLVLVDPDSHNGSVQRVLKLAAWYRQLHTIQFGKDSPLFATKLAQSNPTVWTPFGSGQATPTMNDFFNYGVLRASAPHQASLFDMLYTPEQREAKLNVGFRGRPSIGAAVFGAKMDSALQAPWDQIAEDIKTQTKNGLEARVFVIGSLFGGTGAAGLPTIPKLLKYSPELDSSKLRTGAALLLPYFTFNVAAEKRAEELFATPDAFLLNSKEALRYYANFGSMYNRLYVLGLDTMTVQPHFSIGGKDQDNSANIVEFLAALGALNFFQEKQIEGSKAALLGRNELASFGWRDVPDGQHVQGLMGQFARMAFVYLSVVYPHLQKVWEQNPEALRAAWHVDLFAAKKVSSSDQAARDMFDSMRSFAVRMFLWLREMHSGAGGARGPLEIQLARTAAFARLEESGAGLNEAEFPNLMMEATASPRSATQIWRLLCDSSPGGFSENTSGFGYFFQRLYKVCQQGG